VETSCQAYLAKPAALSLCSRTEFIREVPRPFDLSGDLTSNSSATTSRPCM
jgi:hypothetical protein